MAKVEGWGKYRVGWFVPEEWLSEVIGVTISLEDKLDHLPFQRNA